MQVGEVSPNPLNGQVPIPGLKIPPHSVELRLEELELQPNMLADQFRCVFPLLPARTGIQLISSEGDAVLKTKARNSSAVRIVDLHLP